jgi:hypothetical protein
MNQIRRRLTYANVMSTIAAFLALGGAAVAATQLPKNSVGTKQLKKNAVTASKLKKNAVTAAKIKTGAVSGAKLADGSVTETKLADGSVSAGKLGEAAVTTGKIADGAVTGGKLATQYLPAATVGVPLAGANVSASGTLQSWFNRAGGEPSVQRVSTGQYVLIFPGLEGQFFANESIAIVSLVNSNGGRISRADYGGNPGIFTYDNAGGAADADFNVVLFSPNSK